MSLKAPMWATDESCVTSAALLLIKALHRNGNGLRWRLSGSAEAMPWQVSKGAYHRELQGFLNEYVLAVKGIAD